MIENLQKRYTEALKMARIAEVKGDASAKQKREEADKLFSEYKSALIEGAKPVESIPAVEAAAPEEKPKKTRKKKKTIDK